MLCLVFAFWYLKVHDDIDADALETELRPLRKISSSFVPDTFETVRDVTKTLNPVLTHGHRKDFFQGGEALADFSTGHHKNLSKREGKSDEISFFLLETKKTTFFAKNVIEKCQISKSRSKTPFPPLSTPMILEEFTGLLLRLYLTQGRRQRGGQ